MIQNPIEITEGGKTFKRLTMSNDFWAVGYPIGSKDIYEMSYEDSPTKGGNVIDGPTSLDGFASDDWDEFNQEIDKRGLIRPESIDN